MRISVGEIICSIEFRVLWNGNEFTLQMPTHLFFFANILDECLSPYADIIKIDSIVFS